MPIPEANLRKHYLDEHLSMAEIAKKLECSINKVVYSMDKYGIERRSISDAIYTKHNPAGDPFSIKQVSTPEEAQLLGLGLGLYWGEGNKANKYSVRLGNTDPELIKVFIKFLEQICGVSKSKLRFGIQLFSDCSPEESLDYWKERLGVGDSQFYKVTVTMARSKGTYRHKNRHGVLTVYCHNKKLRDTLVQMLPR